MSTQVFQLAILISLRDAASAGADRVSDKLRSMGREGKAALSTFEDLRKDMRKGLALAGTGMAGLAMLKGGVKAAGDFEASLTDLRLAFSEVGKDGAVDLGKLNNQMTRLESLSVKLGNDLPGNTAMFVEMLAQLKQGGLDTEAVLNGAGEAVANLAVVTNQVPKDLAKDFSQFGMQMALKPDEYVKAADLFARIKARTDLGSGELIEGSKYFQLRAGAPLGLKGFEGAETGARLMAAMKRVGLEGSVAGTGTANFFKEIADPKKLKAVKKDFGIDLKFFNEKGDFLGIQNVFRQMEKLRQLSTQKRMNALDKLAGSEGASVGSAMIDMGLQGWLDINEELKKTPSLQEQINQKTATYNAKLDALTGSVDNLKATTFGPMVDSLKPLVDTANSIVGSVQEWAKEHQTIAGFGTKLFALSAIALTVQGGFNAMRGAWGLWKIASAVGAGEDGLLRFLRNVKTETGETDAALGKTTGKAGRFKGVLDMIPSSVKTTIALIAIEYGIRKVGELTDAIQKLKEARGEQQDAAAGGLKSFIALREAYAKQGKPIPKELIQGEVKSVIANLNADRSLEFAIDPNRFSFLDGLVRGYSNPYLNFFGSFDPEKIKKYAPHLAEPDIMKEFVKSIRGGLFKFDENQRNDLFDGLREAFPEAFEQASQLLQDEFISTATYLRSDFVPALGDAGAYLRSLSGGVPITRGGSEAGGKSGATDKTGVSPLNVRPKKNFAERYFPSPPPMATGGFIEREGLVHIHTGERVIPAARVRRDADRAVAPAREGDIHLHFHIAADSPAGQNPRSLASLVAHEVRKQRERR